MNRFEARVQLLMAVVGSILALAVFTPQLFAEDPLVPEGANYQGFNPNLTWQGSGGAAVGQPGKVCVQQAPCLLKDYCYSPYIATFGGTPYQSMKDVTDFPYGLCQLPQSGMNPGPDCLQRPTVRCTTCEVYLFALCFGPANTYDVYRLNACNVN